MVTVGESVSQGLVLDVDNEAGLGTSTEEKGPRRPPPPPRPQASSLLLHPFHESFLWRVENKDAGVLQKRAISRRRKGSGKSAEERDQDTFFNFCFVLVALGAQKEDERQRMWC